MTNFECADGIVTIAIDACTPAERAFCCSWWCSFQVKALADAVPTARVVEVPGARHDIYLSHEADVLGKMRPFLDGLRESAVGSTP
jgi:hypothetical protein